MQNRLAAQSSQNRNLALAVQRAQQQQQQQQRRVPQGAQQVDVAGCGGPGQNQGGWPVMNNGPFAPWDSQGAYHNIPQMAPNLGPGADLGLVSAYLVRAGLNVQANVDTPREITFSLQGGSTYWIGGLASGNDFGEIVIHDLSVGGIPLQVVREVDAGFFNVDQSWCEIQIGCVSTIAPLTISFSQIVSGSNPPSLNLMFVGTFQASFGGCGFPAYGPMIPGFVPGFPGGSGAPLIP